MDTWQQGALRSALQSSGAGSKAVLAALEGGGGVAHLEVVAEAGFNVVDAALSDCPLDAAVDVLVHLHRAPPTLGHCGSTGAVWHLASTGRGPRASKNVIALGAGRGRYS